MILHSRPEDPFKVPENFDVGGCSLLDAQHFFSDLDKRLIASVVLTIENKRSILQTTKKNFTICNNLSVYHDCKKKPRIVNTPDSFQWPLNSSGRMISPRMTPAMRKLM